MERKRDGFVPVGDLTIDLSGGLVPARRQARHFTQLDQVTQLVAARDADPELGFMARLLALCSLPRTNPGDQQRGPANTTTAANRFLAVTSRG